MPIDITSPIQALTDAVKTYKSAQDAKAERAEKLQMQKDILTLKHQNDMELQSSVNEGNLSVAQEQTKQEQERTTQSNNQRLTANANARAEKYKANSSFASETAVNRLQDEQNSIKENTLKRYGGVE